MEDIKRFWVRGSEEHPEAVKAALRHAGIEVSSLGCDNEHRIYFLGELGCEAWDDNSILADAIMTNPNWKELDITPFIKRDTKFEVDDYVICGDTCIGKAVSIDSDGKYNFMYNELGITKADIRIWIHEAVQEEAKKLVENSFNNFSVKREISKELLSKFDNYDFKRSLANEIVSKISIAVKE